MCVNDVNAHQSAAAGEKARWRATDRDAPRGRALPERGLRGLQHAMHNVHRPRNFGDSSTLFVLRGHRALGGFVHEPYTYKHLRT